MKIVERKTSERTGDAVWMKFECGAGSRWTSTTEDSEGDICGFSGCNCGTIVRKVGETDDRNENWFGLRVGKQAAIAHYEAKRAANSVARPGRARRNPAQPALRATAQNTRSPSGGIRADVLGHATTIKGVRPAL
jgi:hypothetical protein